MDLQNFLVYAIITLLMAPLLLVYGIPFIVAAGLFNHIARKGLSESRRLLICCGMASLGIAPAYDIYRAPLPIYTWILDGHAPGLGFILASFLVTWVVVLAQTRLWLRLSRRHNARVTRVPANTAQAAAVATATPPEPDRDLQTLTEHRER